MNPRSLAQLAAHPHGFQTGTKDKPGRLILRNVLEHEVAQFAHILLNPENHYPGADAGLANYPVDTIRRHLFEKNKETDLTERQISLLIILKPGLEVSLNLPFERVPHMVNGGHVIGVLTFILDQHPDNSSDCGAYPGIIIHHEARGHGFGKEAFIACLDYVLLGQPTTLRNGNLGGLGLRNAHIETAEENRAFIKLMEDLHLSRLQRKATPDHGQRYRMKVPCVNWTVTKPEWLEARKHIILDWMPEGQQTLSRDGSPDLHELEHSQASGSEHASASGHASGAGHASGSGHVTGIGHITPNQRFGYGAYK